MKKRVLTAVIGLPLVLWILLRGSPSVVLGFFILIQWGMALEIMRLILQGFHGPTWILAWVSTGIYALFLFQNRVDPWALLLVLSNLTLLSVTLAPGTMEARTQRAETLALGLYYSLFPWIMISGLYRLEPDSRLIILLLSIAWAGDTAAYFFGRTWGRRLLAPAISPKKTWLGAGAGLVFSMAAAVIVSAVYEGELGSWPFMLLVGGVTALVGQTGDLFKSVFKRHRGVKDSGRLVPGHGGLLDRLDSLVLAAPVLILFYTRASP